MLIGILVLIVVVAVIAEIVRRVTGLDADTALKLVIATPIVLSVGVFVWKFISDFRRENREAKAKQQRQEAIRRQQAEKQARIDHKLAHASQAAQVFIQQSQSSGLIVLKRQNSNPPEMSANTADDPSTQAVGAYIFHNTDDPRILGWVELPANNRDREMWIPFTAMARSGNWYTFRIAYNASPIGNERDSAPHNSITNIMSDLTFELLQGQIILGRQYTFPFQVATSESEKFIDGQVLASHRLESKYFSYMVSTTPRPYWWQNEPDWESRDNHYPIYAALFAVRPV